MNRINAIVLSGFLSSGKTTTIKAILKDDEFIDQRILIILGEQGEEEIFLSEQEKTRIFIIESDDSIGFSSEWLFTLKRTYQPDLILIEQNGMKSLVNIISELEKPRTSRYIKILKIINTIDVRNYEQLHSIMEILAFEHCVHSDFVILNFLDEINMNKRKEVEKILHTLSDNVKIVSSFNQIEEWEIKQKKRKINSFFTLTFSLGILCTLFVMVKDMLPLEKLSSFSMIFMSIIMQAFPFLMIAMILSALIQIYLTEDRFLRFFPKPKPLSFGIALFAGIILPICDCAVVPLTARLIKKGVPAPIAVTFLLAAPIVNPITIMATLYAFPNQPLIAAYRVGIGAAVALSVGIALQLLPQKAKVLLKFEASAGCGCSVCNGGAFSSGTRNKTFKKIIEHVENEFFNVGRFLIVGAMISGIVQTILPKEWLLSITTNPIAAIIIMMLVAFFMSVCSSADAFIARSFSAIIPMGGVLGFMIFGPMLDLKNVLMMSGYFKRRFILKISMITTVMGFIIISLITTVIYGR